MPAPIMNYKTIRRKLDDLGYYQPLVPEAVPLVEALMQDLLTTTHNLKICKENKKCDCKNVKNQQDVQKTSKEIHHQKEAENAKIISLQRKVEDFELLYKVLTYFITICRGKSLLELWGTTFLSN